MTRPENAAYAYVGALVEELVRSGVRHVCLAPGSRSTPLVLAAHRQPGLRRWVHLDERSAAFFALGLAKGGSGPVALISTSGTAAANFYPAVVEASHAGVPLVVLTADRPRELRDWGAPQAIDQVHLYGRHVRWFVDLAPPEATPAALRYARAVAGRAVAVAQGPPAGPVHLNVPLREPLVPVPAPAELETAAADPVALAGRDGGPYLRAHLPPPVPEPPLLDELAAWLRGARRGLVVCGPQPDPGLAAPLGELAARLGFPLLADPLSGVRCGPHRRDAVVDAYDALLRHGPWRERMRPDLILRVGGLPASRPLLEYLEACRDVPQILLEAGPAWSDPLHGAAVAVRADPRRTCAALLDRLGNADGAPGTGGQAAWLEAWLRANRAARTAMARALAEQERPNEARLFAELAAAVPDGTTVFVGNSMPVRDLEAFWPTGPARVRFLANRGVNGIDGVVSTALGCAAAGCRPLLLVIGDVSFYHDLNGLYAARRYGLDATVVLVHNDGGGIFHFLPQAVHGEGFEELFAAPHGLDFAPAVAMYGGRHRRVQTWEEFRAAVREGLAGAGLTVVEVRSQRHRNAEEHRAVWRAVAAALDAELDVGVAP